MIDDPLAVEKILRHLGVWHDPPAGLSPPDATGPNTYEPCWVVDPMPDYENVLTDSEAPFGRPGGGALPGGGLFVRGSRPRRLRG